MTRTSPPDRHAGRAAERRWRRRPRHCWRTGRGPESGRPRRPAQPGRPPTARCGAPGPSRRPRPSAAPSSSSTARRRPAPATVAAPRSSVDLTAPLRSPRWPRPPRRGPRPPGRNANSPPGPTTRPAAVATTSLGADRDRDLGPLGRHPPTARHRRTDVVAAGDRPRGLPGRVDDPHLRRADREQPDQADGHRDEQRQSHRQLGGDRAALVAAAAPVPPRRHPMPNSPSTWSNSVLSSRSPKPPGEQLVEQPGQAGAGGRADGVLGGGDAALVGAHAQVAACRDGAARRPRRGVGSRGRRLGEHLRGRLGAGPGGHLAGRGADGGGGGAAAGGCDGHAGLLLAGPPGAAVGTTLGQIAGTVERGALACGDSVSAVPAVRANRAVSSGSGGARPTVRRGHPAYDRLRDGRLRRRWPSGPRRGGRSRSARRPEAGRSPAVAPP